MPNPLAAKAATQAFLHVIALFVCHRILKALIWPRRGGRLQVQPAMARDLFPAGFVSCWGELEGSMQARGPQA